MYPSDVFEADTSSGFDSMLGGGEGSLHMDKETGREAGMLGGAPEYSRRAGFLLGATTPRPLCWR